MHSEGSCCKTSCADSVTSSTSRFRRTIDSKELQPDRPGRWLTRQVKLTGADDDRRTRTAHPHLNGAAQGKEWCWS